MSDDNKELKPSNSEEESLKKVEKLENLLNEMARYKKKTSTVSAVGAIIVVIILVIFLYRLYSFVEYYDTKQLASNLGENMVQLVHQQEAQDVLTTLQTTLLPEYQKELVIQLKANYPIMKDESITAAENIEIYLNEEVKPKIINQLAESIAQNEKSLLENYEGENISPEKLQIIMENSKKVFVERLSALMNAKLGNALDRISEISNSTEKLQTIVTEDASLKNMSEQQKLTEIENRMLETMLELVVYQVNPGQGDMPAYTNGGAK